MIAKSQNKLADDQKQRLQEMITNASQESLVKNQATKEGFIIAALGILILIAISVLVYYVVKDYYYRKMYVPVALELIQVPLKRSANFNLDPDFDYLTKGAAEDLAAISKALTVAIEPLIAALKYKNRYVRADSARALHKITKQSFLENYEVWSEWWQKHQKMKGFLPLKMLNEQLALVLESPSPVDVDKEITTIWEGEHKEMPSGEVIGRTENLQIAANELVAKAEKDVAALEAGVAKVIDYIRKIQSLVDQEKQRMANIDALVKRSENDLRQAKEDLAKKGNDYKSLLLDTQNAIGSLNQDVFPQLNNKIQILQDKTSVFIQGESILNREISELQKEMKKEGISDEQKEEIRRSSMLIEGMLFNVSRFFIFQIKKRHFFSESLYTRLFIQIQRI